MIKFLKKQPPVRLIAIGFIFVILFGSFLLMLPISLNEGITINYIDSLYTSVSAVCITGLTTVEIGTTFSVFGRTVVILLVQVGGLGVATVGAGLIMLMGKKMDLKSRNLIHEAMNLDSGKVAVRFLKEVFFTTLIIEFIGAALSFIVFVQDFEVPKAIGMSIFHAISAFNNAGFDILGLGNSLESYQDNVLFNLITVSLIICGGLGFLVIKEICVKNIHVKKYSLHAKIVLIVTAVLICSGTFLVKICEGGNITWLGAFFSSVTARTAGFATFSFGGFTNAGLMVMLVLMFIGASSGSTGGGIKTTTAFVIVKSIIASARKREPKIFKYSISSSTSKRAFVIAFIGIFVISFATFLVCLMEPMIGFIDVLFEMVSAFATVGLSTGISSGLTVGSKLVFISVMYIGRLGPFAVASLWSFGKGSLVRYPEGNIAIG